MSNYAKIGLQIYEDGQVRYVPLWFRDLVMSIKERPEFCVYYVNGRLIMDGQDHRLGHAQTQMYLRMMENLGLLTSRRIGYIKHYKHKEQNETK